MVRHINDYPADEFRRFDFPRGETVCRASQPRFNCGLKIIDGAAEWSVLFNEARVKDSEMIRTAAERALEEYRG